MRSKGFIGLVLAALIILAAGCSGCHVRNSLTALQEDVAREWANVQSQYQRRANLIPNLVSTVRRAESFDRETIEMVTDAEERVSKVSGNDANTDNVQEYLAAQKALGSSLDRMLDESRQSSQLASVEAFRALQDQLEGTANRINYAHRDYNSAVAEYNSRIRRFPANLVALISGLKRITPFQADAEAQRAPNVDL